MTFAREAIPFVTVPALVGLLGLWRGWPWAAVLGAGLALGVLLFFRIPRRATDCAEEVVLAPASGRVTRIDTVEAPDLGPRPFQRVVTFLSVFDVHVQRAPVDGEVLLSRRSAGRKVAAFRADADRLNEGHLTVIRRPGGELVAVRQIAGLVARRVVCYLRASQAVRRGELMGLIKFGSRVDLLVPAGYRLEVREGQRLREGETPVARPVEG